MNNEEMPNKSIKTLFIVFFCLLVASAIMFLLPKSVGHREEPVSPQPDTKNTSVSVFFASSRLDPEITCTKVFPVLRDVPDGMDEMIYAVEQLLAGPTPQERENDYDTGLNANVRLLSLRVAEGTAYADFDRQLNFQIGGSCRIGFIRTQIDQTLKQFPGVREVVISVEGETEAILEP